MTAPEFKPDLKVIGKKQLRYSVDSEPVSILLSEPVKKSSFLVVK
jgi:hypothetical protein